MNGKRGVVLAALLIGSVGIQADDQAVYSEAANILFGQFRPDDVRLNTVATAVLGVAAGAALKNYKDVIAGNEYTKPVLEAVCLGQVSPADAVESLGVVLGVEGLAGLWNNGPALRLAYLQSFGLLVAKEQIQHPGVVGEHEMRNAAIGALAVMQGIPFIQNTLPGLLAQMKN